MQTSAKYPVIIEGLLELLMEINTAVHRPEKHLPSNTHVLGSIARIYTLAFFFLEEFIDWYNRKATCRLLKSPNLDPHSEFQFIICCIKGTAHGIGVDRMEIDSPESEKERKMAKGSTSILWEEARLSQLGLQRYERRLACQNAMIRRLIGDIEADAAQRARLEVETESWISQILDSASGRLRSVPEQDSGIACLMTSAMQDLGMCADLLLSAANLKTLPGLKANKDSSERFPASSSSLHRSISKTFSTATIKQPCLIWNSLRKRTC